MAARARPRNAHDRLVKRVFSRKAAFAVEQPAARNTPVRLSQILDVPPLLGAHLLPPFEVRVFTDDLSGSVLDDPHADRGTLALVELTRALLHAHDNPASLTRERLAMLARLFEVLLDQPEPLATNDMRALLTYVHALEEGSPVRELLASALRGRARQMYVSGADALIAKGKEQGRRAGLTEGRRAGLTEGRRAGLTEGRRAGLTEGRRAGLTEGLARAVLEVLAYRSLRVPAALRKRVLACRDEARLRRWLERAITARSAAEVLDDDE